MTLKCAVNIKHDLFTINVQWFRVCNVVAPDYECVKTLI